MLFGKRVSIEKGTLQKQLPLKKTLFFLFPDFLRGIATAVFIRKHNKKS